jgi:hypothetical protein
VAAARPGTPFRYVRDAALTSRPGTPFRFVRGTPVIFKAFLATLTKQPGRAYGSVASSVVKLGEALGVNVAGTGQTGLYIAGLSQTAVIVYATVTCKTATAVTAPATVSITTNTLVVFPSQAMIGLTVVDKVWIWPTGTGAAREVQPGDSRYFVVDVAAAASAQTVDVRVYGYEL